MPVSPPVSRHSPRDPSPEPMPSPADSALLAHLADSRLIPAPDLLVIGAGLTGLTAASLAVEKGWKVQVLTDVSPLETLPAQLPGLIWPSSLAGQASDQLREFAFYCRDFWSRLTVRPGMDFEWKVPGILALGDQSGISLWTPKISDLQADGWSIQQVDGDQLQHLLPGWNRTADLGLFFPADGQIHPRSVALSLTRNILARKSSLRIGALPEQIEGNHPVIKTSAFEFRPKFVLWNLNGEDASPQKETLLKAVVSNTSPLAAMPVVADRLILVPRGGGAEVFLKVDSETPASPDHFQEVWNSVLTRWQADIPRLEEITTITRNISTLPSLEKLSPDGNVWKVIPGPAETETLYAIGLAQSLLDWLTSGQRPERLDSLRS